MKYQQFNQNLKTEHFGEVTTFRIYLVQHHHRSLSAHKSMLSGKIFLHHFVHGAY